MKSIEKYPLAMMVVLLACNRTDPTPARDDTAKAPLAHTADIPPIATAYSVRPPPAEAAGGVAGRAGNQAGAQGDDQREAEAEFKAAIGIKLSGEAELDEVKDGVRLVVKVKNAPVGKRGIHLHEKPDCTDIPGESMGEHLNPTKKSHGLPPNPGRHLGDLGNIVIDKDGNGKLEATVAGANLKPNDPMSLLNRALVIHEAEDKGSPHSGGSGKPIACAVINQD